MGSPCSVSGPRAGLLWRLALMFALSALTAASLSGKLGAMQGGALIMLPALLLAVVMLTRPYLGERAIGKLGVHRTRRVRATAPAAARTRSFDYAVRGGRLIATALAGRAPPLALVGYRPNTLR